MSQGLIFLLCMIGFICACGVYWVYKNTYKWKPIEKQSHQPKSNVAKPRIHVNTKSKLHKYHDLVHVEKYLSINGFTLNYTSLTKIKAQKRIGNDALYIQVILDAATDSYVFSACLEKTQPVSFISYTPLSVNHFTMSQHLNYGSTLLPSELLMWFDNLVNPQQSTVETQSQTTKSKFSVKDLSVNVSQQQTQTEDITFIDLIEVTELPHEDVEPVRQHIFECEKTIKYEPPTDYHNCRVEQSDSYSSGSYDDSSSSSSSSSSMD